MSVDLGGESNLNLNYLQSNEAAYLDREEMAEIW